MRVRSIAALVMVVVQVGVAQAPTFVPIAEADMAPAARTVTLAADVNIELAGAQLFLGRAAQRLPVTTTSDLGTGPVHAITLHPDGTLFAACERGLFVLDHEHPVLDVFDCRDGVPPGRPRGVFADALGRLWLCTDSAFGVVDMRFGFGRTFTAADGLPPGPYLRVAGNAGRVELATAAGCFAYQPDQGPPPRVVSASEPRRVLLADPQGNAAFSLAVEALGGATLRQRRRHHHLLQAIDGQTLRGFRPGRHTVEVHAFDRDLRRTRVAEYEMQVPLPAAFDTRFLPLVAALVGALVLWLAWLGGDRAHGRWRRLGKALARALLSMVIATQLLAAMLGYGRSWPFVGFSMYTENWFRDSVLYRPRIVALRNDGGRVPLHENEVGVLQDGYWQMLAEIVHGDDAARRRFLQQIERSAAKDRGPYVGFVLADGRIRLTANGPVDVAPVILVHYRVQR